MPIAHRTAAPPCPADPFEAYRPIEPGVTPTLARVAGLLRRVLNYGKQIVATVRLRASTPAMDELARAFRTTDLRTIIGRLGAATARAAQLEQSLLSQHRIGAQAAWMAERAAAQDAAGAARAVASGNAAAKRAPEQRETAEHAGSRAATRNDASTGEPRPGAQKRDTWLPSTAQLIAQLRAHPVGVVIADICRDLGITNKHPLWPELAAAITAFGGSIAELEEDADNATRWCSQTWLDLPFPRVAAVPYFSVVTMWEMAQQMLASERTAGAAGGLAVAATGPP